MRISGERKGGNLRIRKSVHDRLHQLDSRRGRGGRWNADWRDFMYDDKIDKTPESIINFAVQMLEKYSLVGGMPK